jgi:hypothetical protein
MIYQSMTHGLIGGVGLGLLFAAPWIAAAALLWRHRIDDRTAIPSLGEIALRRLGA